MRLRTATVGVALAIGGLGAAVGIGLAANSISGDSVGLSAAPLSAGDALAPKAANTDDTYMIGRFYMGRKGRKYSNPSAE